MRILFDARKISSQPTGVGYVAKKLLEELLMYEELEIVAFTRKGVIKIFDNPIQQSNLTVVETSDDSEYFGLKRVLFEQFEIPKLITRFRPDILHLTNGFGVPFFINKKKLKIVLTVHDLIPLTPYKELMSPLDNSLFKTLFSYGIKKADSIVTVSKFTAEDVKKYYPLVKSINVAYNGMDPAPRINSPDKAWSNLQKKYDINEKFMLYIGGFAPRKNVMRLLESYSQLVKDEGHNYKLLICGKITNNLVIQDQLKKINLFITSHNLQNQVIIIGYISNQEKYILLSKSEFFIYISLYEGFGLPILEALAVGTPVITSKDSVMEEVANKFASYANPNDINDILAKMVAMSSELELQKTQAKKSMRELIPTYNWKTTGKKYYQIYKSLL